MRSRRLSGLGSRYNIGDVVEIDYHARGRWFSGRVVAVNGDGSFDVVYDDGEEETAVAQSRIRSIIKVAFPPGSSALCYWYRSSQFGAPRVNKQAKMVTILHANNDNTYTVEFEDEGTILDDVVEKHLRKPEDNEDEEISIWNALLNLRKSYETGFEEDAIDRKFLSVTSKVAPRDRVLGILGPKLLEKLERVFNDVLGELGSHWGYDDVAKAFDVLGRSKPPKVIEKWVKGHLPNVDLKFLDLWHFVVMYGNLCCSGVALSGSTFNSALGKTLNEKNFLVSFEQTYGHSIALKLEDAFSRLATKRSDYDLDKQETKIAAKNLMDAFTMMGKGLTISKLSRWMEEADVSLYDELSFADFAAAYVALFPLKDNNSLDLKMASLSTLSDVSVQVLREEKWTGSSDQTQAFIGRLCAGRSDAVITCIGKLRNAFEALDANGAGFLSLSLCPRLFQESGLTSSDIDAAMSRFVSRQEATNSGLFSLPEVFEHFGSAIQQCAENVLTVSEAVSLYRLRFSPNEVHSALKLVNVIVNNIVDTPTQNKFWFVNIDGETFNRCIWQFVEGKKLMKACGFGDPFEMHAGNKSVRRVISLRGLHSQSKQISSEMLNSLKARREELNAELVALEGAPSIAAALREMRLHHSLPEVRTAAETASKIVQNVLVDPHDIKRFRIKRSNPAFTRNLGRLHGSQLLMNAIGYSTAISKDGRNAEGDSTAFVLRPKLTVTLTDNDIKSFKFPCLEPETEQFLLRRKADLENCLVELDKELENAHYAGNILKDSAFVSGIETKDLEKRSKLNEDKAKVSNGSSHEPLRSKSGVSVLADFTKNATPAQLAQIRMIRRVFESMDGNHDGMLTFDDIKDYFRRKGRQESDVFIRKWIAARDVDQDGAVSLVEYISSFTPQFCLGGGLSRGNVKVLDKALDKASPLTLAFGFLAASNPASDVLVAADEILEYINLIISEPQAQQYRVIFVEEEKFTNRVGRVSGGVALLRACGFTPEQQGALLVFRNELGKDYDVVPTAVLNDLRSKMEELRSHRQAFAERSISNLAAVSTALATPNKVSLSEWAEALDTVLLIINNALAHPDEERYYRVNLLNKHFHDRLGRKEGGLQLLHSIGFQPDETQTAGLQLPKDFDKQSLEARKLEIEVALQYLHRKIELQESRAKEKKKKERSSTKTNQPLKTPSLTTPPPAPASSSSNVAPSATSSSTSTLKGVARGSENASLALEEEKRRRQRAEKLVSAQQSNLLTLQHRVEDLQAAQEDLVGMRFEASVGPLFRPPLPSSSAVTVTQKGTDTPLRIGKQPLVEDDWLNKLSTRIIAVESKLTESALAQSRILRVQEVRGFRKSTFLLIGAGQEMELKRVVSVDNQQLHLDSPILYAQMRGAPVRALKGKGLTAAAVEKVIIANALRSLLFHDLVDLAFEKSNICRKEQSKISDEARDFSDDFASPRFRLQPAQLLPSPSSDVITVNEDASQVYLGQGSDLRWRAISASTMG
eukprot:scaffold1310_cov219-Ochromonas_danica.AAC.6